MRPPQRYLLFQVPGLLLFTVGVVACYRVFDLPAWIIPAAAGFWIAKELALYPLISRSLLKPRSEGVDRLIGTFAQVTQTLEPEGWVRAAGELWRARSVSGSKVEAGSEVQILEVDHLTLIVSARLLS